MSKIQGAPIAVMLAVVCAHSHADTIVVNTTQDEDSVLGDKCSLREAVSYIHQKNIINKTLVPVDNSITQKSSRLSTLTNERKILETTAAGLPVDARAAYETQITLVDNSIALVNAELTVLQNTRKNIQQQLTSAQIYGCTPSTTLTADEIILPVQSAPFILEREIKIQDSITIKRDDSAQAQSELTDTTADDPGYAIIQTKDNVPMRLFLLDDEIADTSKRLSIKLSNLELLGCHHNAALIAACAVDGGIIMNREFLNLSNVNLKSGVASARGGALFNDDQAAAIISGVDFERNQALAGAAFYSIQSGVNIQQSLFYKNAGTTSTGTIIEVSSGALPSNATQLSRPQIGDSTLTTNKGLAVSVPEQVRLVGLTIVANNAGIDFRNLDINVSNSIIAQDNGGVDCLNVNSSSKFKYNVFMSPACPNAKPSDMNRQISGVGDEKLFAGTASDSASCDAPPAYGLLCPLGDFGGATLSHKPRLLTAYTALSDSPIVNKGSAFGSSTDSNCSSVDQRGKARTSCDIGAIELTAGSSARQGQDVYVGQTARFSFLEKIGDGELLPSADCIAFIKDTRADPSKDGCPFLASSPSKGNVTFDGVTHEAIYVPSSPYHGFDVFSYAFATTLSRFSTAANDQFVATDVKVVASPSTRLESKNFAGSSGIFSILALTFFSILRRFTKRG